MSVNEWETHIPTPRMDGPEYAAYMRQLDDMIHDRAFIPEQPVGQSALPVLAAAFGILIAFGFAIGVGIKFAAWLLS